MVGLDPQTAALASSVTLGQHLIAIRQAGPEELTCHQSPYRFGEQRRRNVCPSGTGTRDTPRAGRAHRIEAAQRGNRLADASVRFRA